MGQKHHEKLDQRIFDLYVFMAINGSFFKFTETLNSMKDQGKAENAVRMMYYIGQGYAKAVATTFGVSVLWVKPNIFIGRDFYYSSYGCEAVPLLGSAHHKGNR